MFCLRSNVKASCHKHDSLMRGAASSVSYDQQTPPLKCATVEMLTTHDGPALIDRKIRYWSKISTFAPAVRGPYRNIAITFCMLKQEWCDSYPTVKNFENMFTGLTQYTNVTDRRTDRHRETT